jgi:hypothetical protein
MPSSFDWNITLNADDILRAQGSNPEVVRQRRPALVEIAEWAAQEAQELVHPVVLVKRFTVKELRHERLLLNPVPPAGINENTIQKNSDAFLSGPFIAGQLGSAEEVRVVLCTIGGQLEQLASQVISEDILRGLALDAAGSAAAEALGELVCSRFEIEAAAQGKCVTIPYSPGMIDWPVEEGQPQIFRLLDNDTQEQDHVQVTLNENFIMTPRKSVSFVVGWGANVPQQGRTCDFCSLKETCRYQEAYAR